MVLLEMPYVSLNNLSFGHSVLWRYGLLQYATLSVSSGSLTCVFVSLEQSPPSTHSPLLLISS